LIADARVPTPRAMSRSRAPDDAGVHTVAGRQREIDMPMDQRLFDAARRLLEERFAGAEGIAAAVYTADGDLLTSVSFRARVGWWWAVRGDPPAR
jgi:hypothetical protein